MPKPAPARVPVLSFFTGAGFLDLGFMNAGFNIIWHNEIEPHFIDCFECGMASLFGNGHRPHIENKTSLIHLGSKQIAKEAFHNQPRPALFGVIGGPPCHDFSAAGKHRGRDGDFGRLSQTYVNRILDLEPTFFVFENVPGLVRFDKHRAFLIDLLNQLSRKYVLDLRVLNALEFGVPQDRERLFLTGLLSNWVERERPGLIRIPRKWYNQISWRDVNQLTNNGCWPQWFPWTLPRAFPEARTRYPWPATVEFGATPPRPPGIPPELMTGTHICNPQIQHLPNMQDQFVPHSNRFREVWEGDVSGKSFKRLHRWRYSPAAAYGHNEVHLHPSEPRRLSVREALIIQSVPDDYALPDTVPLSHKFKTVSNGVPVKLAQAVASSLMTLIQ
jgi:DNA (cytosine-5)-methyltransferase 1